MNSGLVIYAKEKDKLVEFYSAVLGFNLEESSGEYAVLKNSDTELVVLQAPPELANRINLAVPVVPRENNPIKPVFFVNEIQPVRLLARSEGGKVKPAKSEWEFRDYSICDGCDPEGNIFQLREKVMANA